MIRLIRTIALGGALLLTIPGQALATKVVVDAGHGGKDPGAHGVNGLNESEVTLDIATRLRDELVRRGYDTAMTRTDDTYVSLADRVIFTNRQHADLFVSVHANWYQRAAANGSMVLYYDDAAPQEDYPASDAMKALTPQSRTLAQDVLDSFVGSIGTKNLGLTQSAVYVVRMGMIPSVLVETAFLSNAEDAALLADESVRQRMAVAIERGIEAYKPPVFADLGVGHWARDAVLRLKERGIVEGVGSRFEPERPITRAEFVTMLERAFPQLGSGAGTAASDGGKTTGCGAPASVQAGNAQAGNAQAGSGQTRNVQAAAGGGAATSGSGTVTGSVYGCAPAAAASAVGAALAAGTGGAAGGGTTGAGGAGAAAAGSAAFRDATPKHWAYAALQKAVQSGLLQGYPDGTLRPDSPLKRAEAAALLKRFGSAAAGALQRPAAAKAFTDVPGTYWAAADIAALADAGVVTGVKDKLFMPEKSMTRAEMAVMLDRYLALDK